MFFPIVPLLIAFLAAVLRMAYFNYRVTMVVSDYFLLTFF